MSTSTITVENRSGIAKKYLLFMDAPKPTNGPVGRVFTNVFDTSPKLESGSGSHVTWKCSAEYYALYGTATTSPDGNTVVSTGAYKGPVRLGPDGSVYILDVDQEGNPSWSGNDGGRSSARGGFEINTGNFNYPNKYHTYIGCGAPNPRGNGIRALQTWEAQPALRSQMFPKRVFFVTYGEYEPGTLIDRNTMGTCLKMDFTGAGLPEVNVFQDNSGQWVCVDAGTERAITSNPWTNPNGVKISLAEP